MTFFTRLLSKPTTIPQANPSLPPTRAELQQLEDLRQTDHRNKLEFDAAAATRQDYERTHRILDAISIYKGNAFKRVAAAQENPELAKLCFDEALARQRWFVGRKAVCDLEIKLGVIR